jgi:RNA polymerase-associated protein CTR9
MASKIEILLNNQLLEVDLNDLQGNDDALIGILEQDAKNHHLFLEFAVEYHSRRMLIEFEKFLLAAKAMPLTHLQKNEKYVLMLNTLAAFYIEQARVCYSGKTLPDLNGNQRTSTDLIAQATELLNKIEQITKRNKFTFVLKGNLAMIKGLNSDDDGMDQSWSNYKAALSIESDFVPALIGVAGILFKKKDYKGALGVYQKILCLEPDLTPDVRVSIGICYNAIGMATEAKLAFECALEKVFRKSSSLTHHIEQFNCLGSRKY